MQDYVAYTNSFRLYYLQNFFCNKISFIFQENILQNWTPYAIKYDPLKAGSIDGTDTEPHDKAVSRAMQMHYEPPHNLESKVERTLFVARFGPKVTKQDLKEVISQLYEIIYSVISKFLTKANLAMYSFVE